MVEEILGREKAANIFCSSMLSGLMTEKQAHDFISGMEKDSEWPDTVKKIFGGALGLAKEVPPSIGWLAALGLGTGALGATAYDVIKEHVTHEDPEAKFNAEMEALYNGRKRELEDARWMSRARAKRDELKRGEKRMSTEEYAKAYQELIDILDERKAKS